MSTTADFKNGLVIKFNNDFFTIIDFQHVKPGKGGAFVRTKLKSVTTGRILENTFNAGVNVDIVRIEIKRTVYKNCRDHKTKQKRCQIGQIRNHIRPGEQTKRRSQEKNRHKHIIRNRCTAAGRHQ